MKIEVGHRPNESRIVPADTGAEVHLLGLTAEETAACLGQAIRPRCWARSRDILLGLPTDKILTDGATGLTGDLATVALERDFEDGHVTLHAGGVARVRVDPEHAEPELPMPRSLMLGLGHQWARTGRMSVHAAAVRFDGVSVLMLGDSLAGKSTLTLAALASGGQVLSDDWVLLRADGDSPVCTSLRRRMLLRRGDATNRLLSRIPGAATGSAQDAKTWLNTRSKHPDLSYLNCDAVLHLAGHERRPARTTLEPLSPVALYAELLNSTSALLFDARLGPEAARQHQVATTLVRRPAFRASSGTDLLENPIAVWKQIVARIRER